MKRRRLLPPHSGEEQNIKIVQEGSTLNVGSAISLEAASGSEGQSSFTLTKGLNWRALLSDGWLSWASGDLATSGDEATGGEQILKVKAASSNPYASARTGSITVEGGEIGKDAGLKKTISALPTFKVDPSCTILIFCSSPVTFI